MPNETFYWLGSDGTHRPFIGYQLVAEGSVKDPTAAKEHLAASAMGEAADTKLADDPLIQITSTQFVQTITQASSNLSLANQSSTPSTSIVVDINEVSSLQDLIHELELQLNALGCTDLSSTLSTIQYGVRINTDTAIPTTKKPDLSVDDEYHTLLQAVGNLHDSIQTLFVWVDAFHDGRSYSLIRGLRLAGYRHTIGLGGNFGIDQLNYYRRIGVDGFIVTEAQLATGKIALDTLASAYAGMDASALPLFSTQR